MKRYLGILLVTNYLFGNIFIVTKTADTFDGVCNKDCSLREAIIAANENPGKDIVKIKAGEYRLTIPGEKDIASLKGDLNINDDIVLEGENREKTIIIAPSGDRAFFVDPYGKKIKAVISNLTIKGGASDYGGGILNNGDLTLKNVIVKENEASLGGGILSTYSLKISNSKILNNKALTSGKNTDGFGGGIYFKGYLSIKNTEIANNEADRNGGGIYEKPDSNLTIFSCKFVSNKSDYAGGALSINSVLNIKNALFYKNEANDGGAIAAFKNANIDILNGEFTENKATGKDLGGGGAIFNYQGKISLRRSYFNKNSALGEGGGAIENTGEIDILHSSFTENKALYHEGSDLPEDTSFGLGGAILSIKGSENRFYDLTFSKNEAAINGGAVYNDVGSELFINDSVFSSNKALQKYGGAILNEGYLEVKRSIFEKNEAKVLGGAVSCAKDTTLLIDTTFRQNKSYQNGGALFNLKGSKEMTLKNCKIISNEAKEFGGGILSQSKLNLLFSTVSKNKIQKGGGGIYINENSVTDIRYSLITENESQENGGGIFNGGKLTLEKSTISSNTASKIGGALINSKKECLIQESSFTNNNANDAAAIGNFNNASLTIKNSLFKENVSSNFAGAILNSLAAINIENSTFYKNRSKIGGAISNNGENSKISLTHLTIKDNIASSNSNALYNYKGIIDIANTVIKGQCNNQGTISSKGGNIESNSNSCSFSSQEDMHSINDILIEDPKQNGGRVETAALKENSPAISFANRSLCLQTDQRGEERNDCDSGAYEKTPKASLSVSLTYKIKEDKNKNGKIDKDDILTLTATVTNNSDNPVHNLVLETPMIEGIEFLEGDFFQKKQDILDAKENVKIEYEVKITQPKEKNIKIEATAFGSNAPLTKSNIINISVSDHDPLEAFVKRFYKLVLGRNADKNGLNYWVTIIESYSAAKAAIGFLYSEEFQNKNLTDEEFIKILYNTFFGREADQNGLSFWLNYLNSHSRDDIVKNFIKSKEFKNLAEQFNVTSYIDGDFGYYEKGIKGFISRFYRLVLNRNIDQTGLEYWEDQIINGEKTPAQVALGFFSSKEYQNKHQSDEEFVSTLYKVFFDRDADKKGYDYWKGQLKKKSRTDIVKAFTTTKEFKNLVKSFGIEN